MPTFDLTATKTLTTRVYTVADAPDVPFPHGCRIQPFQVTVRTDGHDRRAEVRGHLLDAAGLPPFPGAVGTITFPTDAPPPEWVLPLLDGS